ncbi:MAG: glycosyltransferase [Plesiomonas shigelloides]
MKTVIFVITKSEVGGAQTWVYEQAKILSGECRIILVTSGFGWLTEKSIFNQIEIIPELTKMLSIKALIKLVFIIRKYKACVVVSSSANAGVYSRVAKLFRRFRCIYVSHGWSCLYNGGRLKKTFCFIEMLLSKITDVVWCISKSDAKKAEDLIGITKSKIRVIQNSISPLPNRKRHDFRGRVLFVGRLMYPKRPDLIAEVIAGNPHCSLDIVGGGDMYSELYKKFGGVKNISFLGEIDSFSDFNKYDIFVLTSESEGLPMSALEAGSAGLPMILSDVGGCFEVLGGNNGILVNNNKEDIESALTLIIDNYDQFYDFADSYRSFFDINEKKEIYKRLIFGY